MVTARNGCAAAIAMLLAVGTATGGDDTARFGGVGSPYRLIPEAATATLKGSTDASDLAVPVCYRWKALKYGYSTYAPVYPPIVYATPAYYAPSYYPTPTIAPPPAPATYYESAPPPAEYSNAAPPAGPTVVVGFQGRLFGGSIAFRPGARAAATAVPQRPPPETTPTPRPTDSFRYDGGPASPVPMPAPDVAPPTDPIPTTVPALHRVMLERSRPRAAYPAYGERPNRMVTPDPMLVKRPAGR